MKEDLFEQLETERLILRKINREDAVDLYNNIYNNYEWYQFYYQFPFKDFTEYQNLVNKYEEWYNNGNHFRWGIVKKENNQMIGVIQLHTKDNTNKNCKLGYIISYKEKQQGYMKEALQKIIDFAFNKVNYHRIEAEIVVGNVASISLAKSVGMQEEKIRHESYLLKDKYYDQMVFTKFNREKEN